MCTVTVIPTGREADTGVGGIRMICNRDELRARPAALPPVRRHLGEHIVLMPVDPVSDGTWIAVNGAGLVITLLNTNPGNRPAKPRPDLRSRGEIIPQLAQESGLEGAIRAANLIDAGHFPPFRIVLIQKESLAELRSDGTQFSTRLREEIVRPMIFTSSGLGDRYVESPRRELFEQMFADAEEWSAAQDEFHTHCWNDLPHLGVLMSRPEAWTVSRTVVEVSATRATMRYSPRTSERGFTEGAAVQELEMTGR